MTARKWGQPVIICGPHYEKIVYPNDRIANARAECCGLDARDANREGCEARRERMEPCKGPAGEPVCSYWTDGSAGIAWVTESLVRDCEVGERCPLAATLKEAKR